MEQEQKSIRKLEEGVRKRITKGETLQGRVSPTEGFHSSSKGDIVPQQLLPSSVKNPREGAPRRVGRACKPKGLSQLQGSKPQPTSPAFMAPRAPHGHSLEGPAWQLVDPIQPGPSRSLSSALHTQLSPSEELPTEKAYIHRPSQVSVKQAEEHHKKEKKPQKPGKYICQYCSRPCAKPSVLQKHIRSHTGERPYPCIPCGFSFKTKSNLYKHRKSHAHRIKAGLASEIGAEMHPSSLDLDKLGREEIEDPTEGESTDSEEETSTLPSMAELSPLQKHGISSRTSHSVGSQHGMSHDVFSLAQPSTSLGVKESTAFADPSFDSSQKLEDSHSIKQKLALRLSERKKASEEQTFLSPGSKGSTESGYFSRSESAEQQITPSNTNAKSYAEIILGKCGKIGQRTSILTNPAPPQGISDEKPSMVPLSVPRTQVIEHITKLITINEAVVDTSEIDSVKPRRSSLSRRSSIESPKATLYREPFQFDLKSPGSMGQMDPKNLAEKVKGEHSFLSLQQSHSATETVPLLRSHSMPSSCTISSPHPFRASYSFDERIVDSDVLSHSQAFSSHPRLLKRQPAIELPLGMEYTTEEGSSTSKDIPFNPSEDPDAKESETSKKCRKGGRIKGLIYECNICGARYKKRGNYETHKKYYCSDVHIMKPQTVVPHSSAETEKGLGEHETWPQIIHYKLGHGLELTPLRKRRKEKSLGDEEDPPAFDTTEYRPSATVTSSHYATSDTDLNISRNVAKHSADQSEPMSLSDAPLSMTALESKERTTISKEISVIQHTSSFEKAETMELLSSFEDEEKPLAKSSSFTLSQHPRPSQSLQPKLVRQHNIQVPEILVTEEPDKPEAEPEPPIKEEKLEEFQWPQRSQSLSQLPAEKLPPKKKRLRLAEMAQSSGESSFESMSLTRSPSQESSLSHASSRSVSFDREEITKPEVSGQTSEMMSKSFVHHMLTVPSHHQQVREMRRSASEQTPDVSHTSQISENRSKSFDCGSLQFPASTSGPTAQERRKCFSIRQSSLSRRVEHEPELMQRDWKETETLSSSSQGPKCTHQSFPTSHESLATESSQQKQSSKTDQPLTEDTEKAYLPQQLSLFHDQPPLQLPENPSELISSQAMSDLLSNQFPLSYVTPTVFQTPTLPLQHTLLHPSHIQIPQHLTTHTDIPFREQSSFLSLPSTFLLSMRPQFALPLPTDIGMHYSQLKPMISLPVGTSSFSPCKTYFLENLHTTPDNPLTSESSTQAVPVCSDPTVSLVVPVRVHTHMPSYGTAMYTTLSQILVTQPHCSSSAVLRTFNESKSKGFDLAHILPEDQSNLYQAPYLHVPFPTTQSSSYIPFKPAVDSHLGLDGSSSSVGGSKRMLSPAGSLELTMETQQQKRVKEEEISDNEGLGEILKPFSGAHTDFLESKTSDITSLVTRIQRSTEILTQPSVAPENFAVKEKSQSPLTPTLPGPSNSKSPEKYKEQKYTCKVQIKTEDFADILEPSSSFTASTSGTSASFGELSQQGGTEARKVQSFPTLHTTTNVSWCYLNYVKPNHAQQNDRRASVYASWCISLYNPNLPGVSTRTALSLLRSKQKNSIEIYSMADALQTDRSLLVPSRERKPKMTEAHLPPQVQKQTASTEKEEEDKVRTEEEVPAVRKSEPSRIRIFEGGYKSNEEYVYVRGRGRGKYVCEECGIRCKKPSMLKKHIRTHTDLRPYVCKHCNFAFKTKGNLTKHMKSKAHSKKCQELGLVPPSPSDLEAEEGTSEERWQDSDVVEEHQFSDLEDTDDEEDSDDEEDEDDEEEESQEEKPQEISPSVSASRSSDDPSQEPEPPDISTAFQFSSQTLPTREQPEKDSRKLLMSDLSAPRETSPRRHWSPGKETLVSSRASLSRRHFLQKRETSPKCLSLTRCPSPRRGMSPCQRLPSTREVSPLRCISPQHLSPRHNLSPRAYVSPERGSSPPVRHMSPSKELPGGQYSSLRSGLASPLRYSSPVREELLPSTSDAKSQFKVQHGVFPSSALPHRTSGTAGNKQKPEHSDFVTLSRSTHSPLMQHSPPRCTENLLSHLPLHSQHLQRTPYPMIPIGGIQMVQPRPGPHPSLLGPPFSELQPVYHTDVPLRQLHQGDKEQLRTTKSEKDKEDRVISCHSTAPQHPPPRTYCQTTCIPPSSGALDASSGPQSEECAEGEG